MLARMRIIAACGGLSLFCAVAVFLLRYAAPESLLPIYQRLGIPLFYVGLLGLQASVFLSAQRFGIHHDSLSSRQSFVRPALIALGSLLILLLVVARTGVGIVPDRAYWGEPGVPLLGWQFALALIAGLGTLLVGLGFPAIARLDGIVALVVWLAAVGIWLSVPLAVMRNSFYAPIGPPALQAFPNSDAGYYDSMAQSLLIGYPYLGEIPTRPLFVAFLTLLHLMVGEHYALIIAGQTLSLAFIPVTLYFLGRALHSQAAGITIAAMAIFRELTALLVSSQTRVSNTKTLLVDLPTLLLVAVVCLAAVRWCKGKSVRAAVVAGGLFGILLLLRTQAILIVPFLILLVYLAYRRSGRNCWWPIFLFVAAAAVTVAPWLVHNYFVAGQLTFDAPFQYQIIASQYRYAGNLDLTTVNLQGKSLAGLALAFALQDPKFVLGFVTSHFLATQIDGLLVLPLIEPMTGLRAPINLYWLAWNGGLAWYNLILVLAYLAVISLGLAAAWTRARWAGMLPLAFSLGYSLANGLGRFSGWRYDLPADWVAYFYVSFGLLELFGVVLQLFGASADRTYTAATSDYTDGVPISRVLRPVAAFVLIGACPWLLQGLAGPRYATQNREKLLQELSAASSVQAVGVQPRDVEAFAALPGSTVQVGRLLYPRYFPRNTGLASAHPWPAYAPRDFPRVGFLLLNQSRHDVVLATRQSPEFLEHGSDAIILGCQGSEYLDARLVLLPAPGQAFLAKPLSEPCP